jgi:hypothetical protein
MNFTSSLINFLSVFCFSSVFDSAAISIHYGISRITYVKKSAAISCV